MRTALSTGRNGCSRTDTRYRFRSQNFLVSVIVETNPRHRASRLL